MLVPIVKRFPHPCHWTATGCGFVGCRVYNRAPARFPLKCWPDIRCTPSNNVRSSVPLFSVKRNEWTIIVYPAFPGLQFLLRKCDEESGEESDEESDDDTARKRDSELVRCG
jgi:hypothetical protein